MTTRDLFAAAAEAQGSDGGAGWGEYLSAGLVTLGIVVALLI